MTPFSFATAGQVIFGAGTVSEVAPAAARLGRSALLVTGKDPERSAPLSAQLERQGVRRHIFSVPREPEIELAVTGAEVALERRCDLVIGFGGGSALDAAKAIAALVTNREPVERYLEVIGQGHPLVQAPLPCIAIPTTAGTGSEVTRNAVLKSVRHDVKVSLRSPGMLPDLAVVDPELARSLPPEATAATGCDALTQLLEAFVSTKANPLTDGLCREGLARAARALPQAVVHGDDLQARSDMALASLFSGMALANAGLGAVHGIAGPLGGMIPGPHGALCARLLPVVVAANVAALEKEAPRSDALSRYGEAARLLVDSRATIDDLIDWLHRLVGQFGIPGLADLGLTVAEIPALVANAQGASSMKGNPVRLPDDLLGAVIEKAL
jgi:alcohol dehydrogenase class IV